MNKIDAFFVMFSALIVWIMIIFLIPAPWIYFIYAGIASWAVGLFIGRLPGRLSNETERDFLNEMFGVADKQEQTMKEMLECIKLAAAFNHSLSAKIDQLMFEYCPEDMTPEQIANYEAHQRPATKEEQDAVNRALH
jgi:hypothetical protein